jgi:hypothetical protein
MGRWLLKIGVDIVYESKTRLTEGDLIKKRIRVDRAKPKFGSVCVQARRRARERERHKSPGGRERK